MDPKFPMRNTTLCYLEQDNAYLMLHRVTKKNDLNHDKWIGVGGKFEPFESPEDCLVREVREETGLTLTRWRCRGLLTFVLSIKHGLCMANGVGVVDSDYRGELKVPMINLGTEAYTIQPGERVAQLCIAPVYTAAFAQAAELGDTQRGAGGFGSTGK